MTENEWLECSNPLEMLKVLVARTSDRKRRLFAVACCRRVWSILTDARSRLAIEQAERAADESVPELDSVSREAENVYPDELTESEEDSESESCPGVTTLQWVSAAVAASYASITPEVRDQNLVTVTVATARATTDAFAEGLGQTSLIRDIFGNPFRPVCVESRLLTFTVLALAKGIYTEKDFDRLPILADALEDAGCSNADILDHLRGPGPHVRGCWALDLILGKE